MIGRIAFVLTSGVALALAGASYPAISNKSDFPTFKQYGDAVSLGNGTARAYVEQNVAGAPVEIGVALSEQALEGLPAAGNGHMGAGGMTHTFLLELPVEAAPYQFVEVNWNPMGHEPEGVYQDVPHFDFHFWTASKAVRMSIMPEDPTYASKAQHTPAPEYIPEFNAALAPPGAKLSDVAVPMMGVHYVDVRSHELQGLLGHQDAYSPFTATFIHGSWDGQLIFWEPMITRAHIVAKKTATSAAVRDEIIPVPTPKAYQKPGYYPAAYRIRWDEKAREYRIALTQLSRKG
jgi:hypothetical protein